MVDFLNACIQNNTVLFLIFAIANVIDWMTGWIKSRISKCENSQQGFIGVLRKIGSWLVIFISFLLSESFIVLGGIIDLNLSIASFIGWFCLVSLIVNEIRSILENLIECNVPIPVVLKKGLKKFNDKLEDVIDDEEVD